jgi:hypothetical protein
MNRVTFWNLPFALALPRSSFRGSLFCFPTPRGLPAAALPLGFGRLLWGFGLPGRSALAFASLPRLQIQFSKSAIVLQGLFLNFNKFCYNAFG